MVFYFKSGDGCVWGVVVGVKYAKSHGLFYERVQEKRNYQQEKILLKLGSSTFTYINSIQIHLEV